MSYTSALQDNETNTGFMWVENGESHILEMAWPILLKDKQHHQFLHFVHASDFINDVIPFL
jgi:hypothetical protein